MINVENISKLSGIYKFTNKINNKCYIGKAKNLQTRVEGHLKSFLNENHSSYFYKSVRKHGIENFQFEILEEFEKDKITNNELNELEKYWIWIFKSSNSKFGYNLTKGGAWIEVSKEVLTEKYLREKDNNGGYAQLYEVEAVREKLASYAHKQWSGWMEYLFSKCVNPIEPDGTAIIPKWAVKRWKRQIETPYEELSEPEKESDRKEADGMIEIISRYLISANCCVCE